MTREDGERACRRCGTTDQVLHRFMVWLLDEQCLGDLGWACESCIAKEPGVPDAYRP